MLHTKYTYCILESVLLFHPRFTVFPIFVLFTQWNIFRQMVPSQHKYCNCKLLYCLFINQVLQVFKDIRHFCIVVYNYKLASAKRVTMSVTSSLSQHLEHSERCWLSGAGTQREWVISYILVGTARLMTRDSLPDRGQPVCSWISAAHIVRLSHSAVRLSM